VFVYRLPRTSEQLHILSLSLKLNKADRETETNGQL